MVATTGIFRSPLEVWITLASWRNTFSSCSASTRVRSYSSGTRYPPSESVPICSAFSTVGMGALERIMFQKFWRYSSAARPVLVSSLPFMGLPVRGLFTGRFSSASSASWRSRRAISLPRSVIPCSIRV